MCLRRAPEKYITSAMAPVGAALDRAARSYQNSLHFGLWNLGFVQNSDDFASKQLTSWQNTELRN
jgi:hypothetical protein